MKTRRIVLISLVAGVLHQGGCDSSKGTDSNTSWLRPCASDVDCDGPLECLCGMCTRACASEAACTGFGGAAHCLELDGADARRACGTAPVSVCGMPCREPSECPTHGSQCIAGACVFPAIGVDASGTEIDATAATTDAPSSAG